MDEKAGSLGVPPNHGLAEAASALGVDHLVETKSAPDDRRYHIQLAGAVIGRVEALAMVLSSPLATSSPHSDPVGALEEVAFRAAGMRGRDRLSSRMFWSLWTGRRLQCQVYRSVSETGSHQLAAAAALIDGVNALLSAVVHDAGGDTAAVDDCTKRARAVIGEALAILEQPGD